VPPVTVAVEGIEDEAIVAKLCAVVGVQIAYTYVTNGKGKLDRNLGGYNRAAAFSPWLVLRDLDSDAPCAPALRFSLILYPSQDMYLRIPVKTIESWLLADAAGISQFFRVSKGVVPDDPESLPRPKRTLVDLSRNSRSAQIVEDMVPKPGTGREVGIGYTGRVMQFVATAWDPMRAVQISDSLRRCVGIIERLR
jgi:hypothetical protein